MFKYIAYTALSTMDNFVEVWDIGTFSMVMPDHKFLFKLDSTTLSSVTTTFNVHKVVANHNNIYMSTND